MSLTDGSTSRGTAMSMMNSGDVRRRPVDRFDVAARDDRPRRSGGGDDDVGATERRCPLFPRNRPAADFGGERLGVGRGAARDDDFGDALAAQVLRRQRADLAGAEDQHAASLEPAEDLPRERDGREAHRDRALADRRFGAHALADAERPVKQLAEERPGAAPLGGGLKRLLDLSEDLRLADDERIEARRDPEQVTRHRRIVVREEVRQERVARQVVVVAEERDQLLARAARGRCWRRRSRIGCRSRARPIRRPTAAWQALRRRRRGRGSKSRAAPAGRQAPSGGSRRGGRDAPQLNVWLVVTK